MARPASQPAVASRPALSCRSPDVQQRSVDADLGAGAAEPAVSAGEAQDTAQVQAAGLLWDLCAAYPAAAFMLDNQLLDLLAALLQWGSADGAHCNGQEGGAVHLTTSIPCGSQPSHRSRCPAFCQE